MAITIVIGILPLIGFRNRADGGLEQRKYKNFVEAFKNCSTFSYFTVISVKDLKSNITKEICVKGNFVNGAVHMELNLDYNSSGDRRVAEWALAKKERYFEFKRRKALENISFFSYDTQLMRPFKRNMILIPSRKYQFGSSRLLSKHDGIEIRASRDEVPVPSADKEKICSDLQKAIMLGDKSDMITEALTNYCQLNSARL